jgi:hypothetical protein
LSLSLQHQTIRQPCCPGKQANFQLAVVAHSRGLCKQLVRAPGAGTLNSRLLEASCKSGNSMRGWEGAGRRMHGHIAHFNLRTQGQ